MELRRAVRIARVLALVGSAGCSSRDPAPVAPEDAPGDTTPVAEDALAEAALDTSTTDTATDTGPVDPFGHCFTNDDGFVTCDPGHVCTYADSGAHCVAGPAGADAQPCGLVACDTVGLCFCASAKNSACLCNFSAGPLPPPDLC